MSSFDEDLERKLATPNFFEELQQRADRVIREKERQKQEMENAKRRIQTPIAELVLDDVAHAYSRLKGKMPTFQVVCGLETKQAQRKRTVKSTIRSGMWGVVSYGHKSSTKTLKVDAGFDYDARVRTTREVHASYTPTDSLYITPDNGELVIYSGVLSHHVNNPRISQAFNDRLIPAGYGGREWVTRDSRLRMPKVGEATVLEPIKATHSDIAPLDFISLDDQVIADGPSQQPIAQAVRHSLVTTVANADRLIIFYSS